MDMEALFIVNSPFQALCALEAIDHFSISSPVFLVLSDGNSRKQTMPLIEDKGRVLLFDHTTQGIVSLIKRAKSLNIKTKRVFVGDYFSLAQYVIAGICAKVGASIYYLDDGNSTLAIFPPVSKKRYESKNARIGFIAFGLIASIKLIKESFFTIYDVSAKNNLVIKNEFKILRNKFDNKAQAVFIIGTNPSACHFNRDYRIVLKEKIQFLRNRFPGETIYYCPHRRDETVYGDFFYDCGVLLFNTEVSVEVDFYKKNITPVAVAGFGSTALLTLKVLYPNVMAISFKIETDNDSTNKTYSYIGDYFKHIGIEIL